LVLRIQNAAKACHGCRQNRDCQFGASDIDANGCGSIFIFTDGLQGIAQHALIYFAPDPQRKKPACQNNVEPNHTV
jgi:hypothetical protein